MAKQSSVNLDITNNADGFDISGGTTSRKLGVTGGDVTIAGSGSAVVTFPTTSTTIAGLGIAQSFTALQTFSAGISASGATFASDISVNSLTVGRGRGGLVNNVAVGNGALAANTTGNGNIGVGTNALDANTIGTDNLGVGTNALGTNINGINNVGLACDALFTNSSGGDNIAVGCSALYGNSSGGNNVGLGTNALGVNSTGNSNIGLGANALGANTTGSTNVGIGRNAGRYRGTATDANSTGQGGIYIGYQARGSTLAQTNEIVIGVDALGLGSNTAVIGATAQSAATIYGVLNLPSGLSAAGATFSGSIISTGYQISSGAINAQIGSYTLVAGDNGKIITMNVASANTLTVPASLAVGFNCTVIQLGAGQTTITASGTTLNSYQGYLKISGQHGSASIVSYTSNVYNVAGNLSA